MSNLEQEIIDAANEVTEAKLAVVEKEQAFRELVRRATSGTEQHEARASKIKRDAATAKVRSIQTSTDPDKPNRPGPKSPVKQKIIDVLRASTVPLSVALIADRTGLGTSNTYYHLGMLRSEGIRLNPRS